ncbi:hypothetical protein SLEP1_g30748 [Rubroshorea leprosula]|uniref:Amidase domain-containing protein n=1 Tax=Rubroshorea leprosula TaxID=152421 RepID=A0AAV5KAR2_9ROSI|nr:hypothetical protein SLEP1_g30748 [Rubroshorea leprosula]
MATIPPAEYESPVLKEINELMESGTGVKGLWRTDTGGSVRVPASYCGILGFRPSHDVVPTAGVTPMGQSFDTVGWFARDPLILSRVGHILLHLPMVDPIKPIQVIIPEDCFSLSSIPSNQTTEVLIKSVKKLFGDHIVKHVKLGDYVKDKVPSLQKFMNVGDGDPLYNIASLAALSSARSLLLRYEFKNNHAEWITTVNPDLGPRISEEVWEAVRTTGENIDTCHSVKIEFSCKRFDVNGYVTGFGNPDWARTHPAATSTAPAVLAVLGGGATCVGKTVMDEMAYSINGENKHYGTPRNPCAPDRVPGGSSSGSAVAVAAKLVDFSLGTDTGGSVRVPASYCGILGDPSILSRVGHVLLHLPMVNPTKPIQVIISEDCFSLSSIPSNRTTEVLIKSVKKLFGDHIVKHVNLGDYVKDRVPSLQKFMNVGDVDPLYNIASLAVLSSAMRLLQRYEFKNNHAEWITRVNPDLGPGIFERVWEAVRTTGENIDTCHSDSGILALPTIPGAPPKLQTDPTTLEVFRARAFSLLSVAGVPDSVR